MEHLTKLKTVLQSNYFYVLLVLFTCFYIFIVTYVIHYQSNIKTNNLVGIVTKVTYQDYGIKFTLKSTELVECTYYTSEYIELLGKKVSLTGLITKAKNNTIPNTFNYYQYLYNNKIYTTFKVSNLKIIKKENIFYKVKNIIIKKINLYNEQIRPYLKLFLLGDKSDLDNNTYNIYKTNGIWHLFAISGMHITLIIYLFNLLLKKFKYKKIVIASFLIFFLFLTNFSASLLRVVLFYLIKNIFNYFNINLKNYKILIICAFLILIFNPFLIYNVGFQYSFIISFALMLLSYEINGNYLMKIFKISFISLIVSLPITINLNYEINILSIILNIFYVPFISLIIFPLSLITFLIPIINPLLKVLITILEVSNNIFYNLKLNIIIPKMPYLIIIIYYLILYLIYKYNYKINYLLLILIIFINIILPKLDSSYYIYYLDVSQGDASIIISPYKKEVIMVDTGGLINSNYHISDNIILFLKSLGISKINLLVTTHGDFDHIGEAINIINNYKVKKVIFNCGEYNALEKDLIKVLNDKHINYNKCISQYKMSNNQKLYFINQNDYNNENDNSNVFYTNINNYQFLFMGDASKTVEDYLLSKYNLNNIDVLKVGHHGSKTSSSKLFIDSIKPKYAIISVGKNNLYGHPNAEVLNNLNNSNIYRTDEDGSIMFKIKNNKLKIKTFKP